MFFLLPIDGLLKPFLGRPLLQIKLFLELNIAYICIHLDHIFPKDLLLVIGLLDFA